MSDTMVERIARYFRVHKLSDDEYEAAHSLLRDLRQPTKAMVAAGDDVAGTLAITHDYSGELTWERMIDAAIEEGKAGR